MVLTLVAATACAARRVEDVPESVILCSPLCKDGEVICTWIEGGNGFAGGTDCQRKCGSPVGGGEACKMSANNTCYWAWTKAAGWACFSGSPPCLSDESIIGSAYLTCADLKQGYGGCEGTSDCQACCSKVCHCKDVDEGKSECACGKTSMRNSLLNKL